MSRLAGTLEQRYGEGVTHPSRVPGAEDKRKTTNLERYGAENVFSRESKLFDGVQAASAPYRPIMRGADNPFARPEVQAKIRQANLERYGVENPNQRPEVRSKTKATNLERYGTEEALAAPVIRERIKATNLERYGGPAPSCSPEVNEKARQTNLERWGVEWTSMLPEVRQKQLETMLDHYGAHYFGSDIGKETLRSIFMQKYGVPHPMQVPEIAFKALVNAGGKGTPNQLEVRFAAHFPTLLYTGDGGFWRWLPKLGHHKNPDFILPGPDSSKPKHGVTKVVELFGNYWHSRMFTGKANFEHERELVEAYQDIGIDCLIVWESEVKACEEEVLRRVTSFLGLLA